MTGDEYGGQWCLAFDQNFLEFKTAHAGHADIHNEHAHLLRVVGFQKLFGAGIAFYAVAVGLEQPSQRIADGFVIVHNVNRTLSLGCSHASYSWVSGVMVSISSFALGNVKRKIVPPSGLGSAHRRP